MGTVQLDGEKMAIRLPPPSLGEHSAAILQEFGFTPVEIDGLVAAGVVAT